MFKLFLVYIIVHHMAVAYGGPSSCSSIDYYNRKLKLEICAIECCGRSCSNECRDLFCKCHIGCCNNYDPCEICYQPTVQPTDPSYCFNDADCIISGFCDLENFKCSSSDSPTEHGSVETTTKVIEPAEDVEFQPTLRLATRSSSASFHLTTVKIVLIVVGCLFLLVPVIIIAFILDVKRRHANSTSRQAALLPETVIASSTSTERVPQLNSAENRVSTSTEFAVQNPNQYPEMSLAPSTFHRGPPPPYTPHARPSTPPTPL